MPSRFVVRQICALAGVEFRTVKRYYEAPDRIRPASAMCIRKALATLGLGDPHTRTPPTVKRVSLNEVQP
jgi:hypothetical protein